MASGEEAELKLLNGAEFKIALADTDAKLQRILSVYLAPILLKLDSPHEAVRRKVLEISKHVTQRLHGSAIQLPFQELLKLYSERSQTNLAKTVALKYLRIAVDAEDIAAYVQYLPVLCQSFWKCSDELVPTMFQILVKMVFVWSKLSPKVEYSREALGFDANPKLASQLSDLVLDLMLYSLPIRARQQELRGVDRLRQRGAMNAMASPETEPVLSVRQTYQGLSEAAAAFVAPQAGDTYLGVTLDQAKKACLSFVLTEAFTNSERWAVVLVAAHDACSDVKSIAEAALRHTVKINTEDANVVMQLVEFCYYDDSEEMDPTQRRTEAKEALQLQALALLSKSKLFSRLKPYPVKLITSHIKSESAKMRYATLQLLQSLAIHSAIDVQDATIMLDSIYAELSNFSGLSDVTKGLYYTCVGILSKIAPERIRNDQGIVASLFEQMVIESPNVRLSIEECVSVLIPLHKNLEDPQKRVLLNIIGTNINSQHVSVAAMALKFVTLAFDFKDLAARFLCLKATLSSFVSVKSDAEHSLNLYWFNHANQIHTKDGPPQYPEFWSLLDFVAEYDEDQGIIGSVALLEFVRDCMINNSLSLANVKVEVTENYVSKLNDLVAVNSDVQMALTSSFATLWSRSDTHASYERYVELLSRNLQTRSDVSIKYTLEVLRFSPAGVASQFAPLVEHLLHAALRGAPEVKESCASVIALALTDSKDSASIFNTFIQTLVDKMVAGTSSSAFQGLIYCFSALVSRAKARGLSNFVSDEILKTGYQKIEETLFLSKDLSLEASLKAITSLIAYDVLSSSILVNHSLKDIISRIKEIARQPSAAKINLVAIRCLSVMGLSHLAESADKEEVLQTLYDFENSKSVDTLFASGEGLSIAGAGWNSSALKVSENIQGLSLPCSDEAPLQQILDTLLQKYATSPRPATRKASAVWLISLVQYCSDTSVIKGNLSVIYGCFMKLLVERDEFVQETASRGLSLVYKQGDDETRKTLTQNLIRSFTGQTGPNKVSVTGETELFDPGSMSTGDGSVTTYKDICSLASETGNPEMIYQFLSIASSSAMWQGRKGAAFSLGGILSMSDQDLFASDTPQSRTLLVKLFRYRFDPSPSVARSMGEIWKVLVPVSSAVINRYFDILLDDTMTGMSDRAWRVREACTKAMSDLLLGRPIARFVDRLDQIWRMAFRALDDIKESVRVAAMSLCQQLASAVVRTVDTDQGISKREAQQALDVAIPFLLKNLNAEAKEVQTFTLDALVQISKRAGDKLTPYVADLTDALLGMVSEVESPVLNYVSAFHTSTYNLSPEEIDASRAAAVRTSPIMSALEALVSMVDEKSLASFEPKIEEQMLKSVALPSKIATSRLTVLLVLRKPSLVRPYASNLLKALTKAAKDRNSVVQRSYAEAVGYVCRVAPDVAVERLMSSWQTDYFTADEHQRAQVSELCKSFVSSSGDKVSRFTSLLLPLVSIAKNDVVEDIRKRFALIWNESTGGSGSYQLYSKEILALVREHMASSSWTIKRMCASVLVDMADKVDFGMEFASVYDMLVDALRTRTWDGKEVVLQAFITFSCANKQSIEQRSLVEPSAQVVMRELKRNNTAYRRHALKMSEKFFASYEQVDMFDEVVEIVTPYMKVSDTAAMDIDDDIDERDRQAMRNVLAQQGAAILSTAFRTRDASGFVQPTRLDTYVDLLEQVLVGAAWNVKVAVCNGVAGVCGRCRADAQLIPSEQTLRKLWLVLMGCAAERSFDSVRQPALHAMGKYIAWARGLPSWDLQSADILRCIKELRADETSQPLRHELETLDWA